MWRRLRGYAGWLVLDPEFRQQRDELAAGWADFAQREHLPLRASVAVPSASPARIAQPAVSEFQAKLDKFLLHWGLAGMATWDLPEPQGPLIPALMKPDSPAMPHHGLHIVLPTHYPLTSNDLLLAEIRRQQQQIAAGRSLDAGVPGLAHFDAYGRLFEVYHLETIIRTRYGKRGGGFMGQMENALAHDGASLVRPKAGPRATLRFCGESDPR